MATDPYQTFIDALAADPDLPSGAVITPLPAHSKVNIKAAKTAEADQWQLAVEIDMPVADALVLIVTQYERAKDRVLVSAARDARQAATRAAQETYNQTVTSITEAQRGRLATKHAAIKQRHSKDETDG